LKKWQKSGKVRIVFCVLINFKPSPTRGRVAIVEFVAIIKHAIAIGGGAERKGVAVDVERVAKVMAVARKAGVAALV
jgi:hypothetical protein